MEWDRANMMKAILVAVNAGAVLAAATVLSAGGNSVHLTSPIIGSASAQPIRPTEPYPGYIAYADNDVAVPTRGCYWTRLPVYDNARKVVGWLGRPVAVCPASP
jgi:hypothetical protein